VVAKELGWLVRPQPVADKGIDAHIEVVNDGKATGRLIALQVKTGSSWFNERTADGFVFRPKTKHVTYWLGHSLPGAVVLVDLEVGIACWQLVSNDTLTRTGKGWKLTVPMQNTLSMSAAGALAAASEGDPYTLRLRQFQLARAWMEILANGGALVVELDEWVNKTSGRASLLLSGLDADDVVVAHHEWPWITLPMADYAIELPRMFPWATLSTNDEADHDQYEAECGIWDAEDDTCFFTQTFDEWKATRVPEGIRPAWADGEVAHWRLDLELSDIGRAFLVLDDALAREISHALFD
jgi:hypothetical protein